jgi:FkbM family methyltransferase
MSKKYSLSIHHDIPSTDAQIFCDEFIKNENNRYVFGCNQWGQSIAEKIDICAFVDDLTDKKFYCGKPVLRSNDLPKTAMVVSAIVGERPISALSFIKNKVISAIDYFAFQKYSGLQIKDVLFLGQFDSEFNRNQSRYDWLYNRLSDDESRQILNRLINFRLSRDLKFMRGFEDEQHRQYFEPFLNFSYQSEVFLDIGCYDGYTSLEFIKKCPGYRAVHVFEPDPLNMVRVKERLGGRRDIFYHPFGVSDADKMVYFSRQGSASAVNNSGELTVPVKRIDDVIDFPYSFLKMDIEGSEIPALNGARQTIERYHPKLAISVYHNSDDLWRIPELVLSFREGYDLFLRHYTEGLTETVIFFIPQN